MEVGYYTRHVMWFLVFLTTPINWPMSKVLDWVLGKEAVVFRRAQLKALVDIHGACVMS